MSIDAQIKGLRAAASGLANCVESLGDDEFLAELGNWSPRDIVAHLIGWNRYAVRGSQQLLAGELPFYDVNPGEDYWRVNADIVAGVAATDRGELLGELESSIRGLVRFLESLDPDDWQRETGVEHRGQRLTVRDTVDELIQDYIHHSAQIRDWSAERGESTGHAE
jgi:hypothetical protein